MKNRKFRLSHAAKGPILFSMAIGLFGMKIPNASAQVQINHSVRHSIIHHSNTAKPKVVLSQKKIYLNGVLLVSPVGFAYHGTTYMPIWYVSRLLTQLGIRSSWDGTNWSLTVPTTMPVDLTNISTGNAGSQRISLNGTVIFHITGIPYRDPFSHVTTEYMPIWYLQQALRRVGVTSSWDGTNWSLTENSANLYSAYDKQGELIGSFSTLASAQTAALNAPGAVVKNVEGTVIFTTPDFLAVQTPLSSGKEFSSLTAATQYITNQSVGYVVDELTNMVVKQPSNHYYLDSEGHWENTITGWQGTTNPSFAKPGYEYVAVDQTPGHSPHATVFYAIADSDGKYIGGMVGTFENPFRTVDLNFPSPTAVTAPQIDTWLASKNSPLTGLGAALVAAQSTYSVNATYLLAHAIIESAWGKSSIASAKNNLYGYGAYDADPADDAGTFPSEEYAIRFQAYEIHSNYLTPDSAHYYQSPTLDGMNEHYATDPSWAPNVADVMDEFVAQTNGTVQSYTQYAPGQQEPSVSATEEPVYFTNGANGTIMANPFGSLPVVSDPSLGASLMFPGFLQSGSTGYAVKQVQRALNLTGATLVVDGQFGPATEAAVNAFQQKQGLAQTGVVNGATWAKLVSNTGSSVNQSTNVQIDEMAQGMVGTNVTLWYHILSANVTGWVDSQYVTLNNVFRFQTVLPGNIPVYQSDSASSENLTSLHSGDYVVCANPSPTVTGFIALQLSDEGSGAPYTGFVKASSLENFQLVTPPKVNF